MEGLTLHSSIDSVTVAGIYIVRLFTQKLPEAAAGSQRRNRHPVMMLQNDFCSRVNYSIIEPSDVMKNPESKTCACKE